MFREIRRLLHHEFLLEWRNPYAIMGVLIFLIAVIFICYLMMGNPPDAEIRMTLFWIIAMFIPAHTIARSFLQQPPGLRLYYYTLSVPQSAIIAKLIYNTLLLFLLLCIAWVVYVMLLGNFILDMRIFAFSLFLGAIGLSGIFTLMSAVATGARNAPLLVGILSFPLLLPLLTTIIRLCSFSLDEPALELPWKEISVLFLLDVIIVTLSYLLFPYLWRE